MLFPALVVLGETALQRVGDGRGRDPALARARDELRRGLERLERAPGIAVGLADPRALTVALAARDAVHFLGQPEGELALAEAVVYIATAPKSNRVYVAYGKALEAAREHPAEPVPLHIRNAPTSLMKELGYGAGYRYAHDAPEGYLPQEYLPEALRDRTFYEPTAFGFEETVEKRMRWWRSLRQRVEDRRTDDPGDGRG